MPSTCPPLATHASKLARCSASSIALPLVLLKMITSYMAKVAGSLKRSPEGASSTTIPSSFAMDVNMAKETARVL